MERGGAVNGRASRKNDRPLRFFFGRDMYVLDCFMGCLFFVLWLLFSVFFLSFNEMLVNWKTRISGRRFKGPVKLRLVRRETATESRIASPTPWCIATASASSAPEWATSPPSPKRERGHVLPFHGHSDQVSFQRALVETQGKFHGLRIHKFNVCISFGSPGPFIAQNSYPLDCSTSFKVVLKVVWHSAFM